VHIAPPYELISLSAVGRDYYTTNFLITQALFYNIQKYFLIILQNSLNNLSKRGESGKKRKNLPFFREVKGFSSN